ncbi:hypothetical protein [Streptomyces sp. AM 2-1-1]|uniref:hypothetical protein n=1 Tax=Streptomyces sp. AM 2-1-1 TaxID=3028709 RepID=UPI0023B8AC92|nr:hypothetical protein [Streptomyces sp. AM 2-1-1]WEH43970.1 hypothetical protein PZB77_30885 [Streptomyces sp. AM 2-1-1]
MKTSTLAYCGLQVLGWLRDRADDINSAVTLGWSHTALWLKAAVVIGGLATAALLLGWTGHLGLQAAHALPWPTQKVADPTGLLATVDQPVRRYLNTHTAHLPVTPTTAYALWQATGALALVLGFFRSSGGRILWLLWGAFTVAIVFTGTPAPGREIAAGIAALGWAALSLLALRGISLSPTAFINVHVQAPPAPPAPQIHATIHVPHQAPAPPVLKPFDPQQPPSLN